MRQLMRQQPAGSGRSLAFMTVALGVCAMFAYAQTAPRITNPTEGQNVRGEITVQFDGVPDGGYAMVKVDGQFKTATAGNTFILNTFPPTFPGDGPHNVSITAINAAGKLAGESHVTFNVANNVVEEGAPAVKLIHWQSSDRLAPVQRYRIYAESNAIIDDGQKSGAGGSAGGSGGGAGGGAGGGGGSDFLPAPLDWQYSALVRRLVRDVGMVDNSANVRTVVQEAYQRQRVSETQSAGGAGGEGGSSGGSGGGKSGGSGHSSGGAGGAADAPVVTRPGCVARVYKGNGTTKGPWNEDSCGPFWDQAPELGQYFVKMILPTGEEVNGTRKSATVALADLFPVFPPGEVRPGSTWQTTMTFITELSTKTPINLRDVPITFTAFENLTTPSGEVRRAAKLESQRFRLPPAEAVKIAQRLEQFGGKSAGGGEGGAGGSSSGGKGGGGGAGGAGGTQEVEITVARTVLTRVLWFDVENHRVLRSEDSNDTYYETPSGGGAGGESGGTGGARSSVAPGGIGGAGGADATPAEPKKVWYNMRVTTWNDDRIPKPTMLYASGAGTAHDPTQIGQRDATPVHDPTLNGNMQPGAPTSVSTQAALRGRAR